jgi:hypothetical protein
MTVTVKLDLAVFWCASVELQVTVVVPRGKFVPATGAQFTGSVPSTASVAVGTVYWTIVPLALVVVVAIFAVGAIDGAVVS